MTQFKYQQKKMPAGWLPGAVLTIFPAQAMSATTQPAISATGALLKTSGMLVLVLAIIYGLTWILKRQAFTGIRQNKHLNLIESMPLGKNERLCLVKSGNRFLVIGVTSGGIHQIDEIPADQITQHSSPAADSWQWAQQFLNRK